MGCHTKIHFILMFGPSMLYDCKIDEGFRHVVSDQLRPYFLLDIFRLVGMEIAQFDDIFELAEGQIISIQGAVGDIVKGSICIHISFIKAFFHKDGLFMAANKGDVYRDVKRAGIWEVKIPDEAFGMDVFCTEEEVLSVFYDMSHVVIGQYPRSPIKTSLTP